MVIRMADQRALRQFYPKRWDIPIAILAASALLVVGLWLPVITFHQMVLWKNTFSVTSGIWSLYEEGDWFLAAVIFVFSIVFPLTKLGTLLILWFQPMSDRVRKTALGWLENLGRWSMLDVFVLAVTIVIVKMGGVLAKADAKAGIYVFSAAIILSMIVTTRVEQLARKHPPFPTS